MIPRFRAWDSYDEQIVTVLTIDLENKIAYVEQENGDRYDIHFDNLRFLQATGLSDKGNVEIFADDIGWDDHQEVYGKVIYDEGKFSYEWENVCNDLCEVNADIDIVGNIYENPELLEVEG